MKILSSILPERLHARVYEIVLFVIVGVLNTAVDFTVLNLLIFLMHHDSGVWLIAFTCLGFLAAVINSYVLNGRLTFRGQTSRSSHVFIRFIAVNMVGMVINSAVVWLAVQVIGNKLPVIIAINVGKLFAIMCSLTWNYFAIKRWVFNGQSLEPSLGDAVSEELLAQIERESSIENQISSIVP